MSSENKQSAYDLLSPKRRAFVDAYFECKFNGTHAAIKAGYSEKTANEQAARLLANVSVKRAVEERRAVVEVENKLETSEVVDKLRAISDTNIFDIVSWENGELTAKDSKDIPRELGACIAEVSQVPTEFGSRIKVKFHDKIKALELLGRYLNMFTDKVQVEGKGLGLVLNMGGRPDTNEPD